MGVVYLAHHATLDRLVALKMILAGSHASPSQLVRFEAEARAVCQAPASQHRTSLRSRQEAGPALLFARVHRRHRLDARLDGKPLPPREAAELCEKICRAIQYAHDRGILHRDIKPANILLTQSGEPKITDFV